MAKDEVWQLFDEQGRPVTGKGISKAEARDGALHAASHVWIWRRGKSGIEILIQKRASGKHTFPDLLDVSAAGHLDISESAVAAAIRETKEEIGIDIAESGLRLINVHKANIRSGEFIEYEYQFIYILELANDMDFKLQQKEVDSLFWKSFTDFKTETSSRHELYVPHGHIYFDTLIEAIEKST